MNRPIIQNKAVSTLIVFCVFLVMAAVLTGCMFSRPDTTSKSSTATSQPSSTYITNFAKKLVTPSLKVIDYEITSTPGFDAKQTPVPTPSCTWIYVEAKQAVEVPILMYHHISNNNPGARYSVTIDHFREQMNLLQQNGYNAITTLELAEILWDGGVLPSRPVVITFDDGNQDVFENAFPILSELEFRAVVYIVGNSVNAKEFLSQEQLGQLLSAGWEVGSHSMTHANMIDPPLGLNHEMYQSRIYLAQTLSTDILTFAYPYTSADEKVFRKISSYGYRAAVCGGYSNQQSIHNIYCLNRREVKGDMNITDFQLLLASSRSLDQ